MYEARQTILHVPNPHVTRFSINPRDIIKSSRHNSINLSRDDEREDVWWKGVRNYVFAVD